MEERRVGREALNGDHYGKGKVSHLNVNENDRGRIVGMLTLMGHYSRSQEKKVTV